MNLIKVKAVQDMSFHWYVIPEELYDDFLNISADDESEFFEEVYRKYRTGWDLNNIQLYADLDNNK